jgi:hypothetical protein
MQNLRMSGWQKTEPSMVEALSKHDLNADLLHLLVDSLPYKHHLTQTILENIVRLGRKSKAPGSDGGKCSEFLRTEDYNSYFGRVMKMERSAKPPFKPRANKHQAKKSHGLQANPWLAGVHVAKVTTAAQRLE